MIRSSQQNGEGKMGTRGDHLGPVAVISRGHEKKVKRK